MDHPGAETTITGMESTITGGGGTIQGGRILSQGEEVGQGGIVPQTTPRAGGGKTGPGTWEVEERRSCVSRPAGTLSVPGTSHD